jgi:hypothetical protein
MLNTIARRAALVLIMVPVLVFFVGFSLVFLAPLIAFAGWVQGGRDPIGDVWRMMVTEGPLCDLGDAWRGEA